MMRALTFVLGMVAVGAPALEAAAQSRAFEDREVQLALAQLKKEPTIQEAQTASLTFFRIDADTVASMRSRAGWKSVLPSVGIKARQNASTIDLDKYDYQFFPGAVAGRDTGAGSVLEFEASGSWDLSRLVFNPEVLDVSSLVVLQEGVLKEVTRLYYTRRRLQVDLILNPPADPATKLSKELRIEELTATLDAMTGNLFSRRQKAGPTP